MNNLLRKCENCIFSYQPPATFYNIMSVRQDKSIICSPKMPQWLYAVLDESSKPASQFVVSTAAEDCSAFRLRDTGVNE